MNKNLLNRIQVSLLAMLVSLPLCAQSSTSIDQDFANPPSTAKPYVWWHWMGANISKEGITKDLEAMKAAGIGGATVFNITSGVRESQAPIGNLPWPERTYRSPAYWDCLRHAAVEAKRLGLEIGLHNTVGYSTTGGPWVAQDQGMMQVLWSETSATGGATLKLSLPQPKQKPKGGWGGVPTEPVTYYRDIAVIAVPTGSDPVPRERIIDLSARMDAQGQLTWNDAPAGAWTIMRLGYGPTGSTPHPVPDELIGLVREANKMDADITRAHWNQVLEPLKEHLGPLLGDSLRHVLIDSYEAGHQNWTKGFREIFTTRYGYDPVPWLAARSPMIGDRKHPGPIIGNADLTARFDRDLRVLVAERFQTQGWEIGAQLVHAAGLTLQMEPYGGPFDTIAASALVDLPMGEFWTGSAGGIPGGIAPAARAAGRRVVGAEAFTGAPNRSSFNETPADLARSALGSYASGVNRLILHHWVHQPFDDQFVPGQGMGWWGTHFSRHQTWSEPGKAFFAYLGRAQALLQRGETVADTVSVERLDGPGDVIPLSVLMNGVTVDHGRIVLPSGRRYAVLIVPHDGALLPATLRRIGELLTAGATIVAKPATRSPSLAGYPACDDEVKTLATALWAPKAQPRLFTELDPALAAQQVPADVILTGQAEKTQVIHRHDAEADIYFVANLSYNAVRPTVSLRGISGAPELWNAEDGSQQTAPVWRRADQRLEVDLSIPAQQSRFIVVRRENPAHPATPLVTKLNVASGKPELVGDHGAVVLRATQPATATVTLAGGATKALTVTPAAAVTIAGPWQVAFTGVGTPRTTVTFPALISWPNHADPLVRYASGTGTYQHAIDIPAAWLEHQGRVLLDLGAVANLATVRLNGIELGTLWKAPFRIDLTPAARSGANQLEIAVINTWHNRLVGDEQEPADVEWGPASKTGRPLAAFPDWFRNHQPRPSSGRRCFVTWNYMTKDTPLLPAGLSGPVTLVPQAQVAVGSP